MAKLIVTTFLSLDGVMQGPGGPEEDRSDGFDRGGWLVPHADRDLERVVTGWIREADVFLFGRRTYEIFAAHWPRVTAEDDVVALQLNTQPKYVVSNTLDKAEWSNASLISGDVMAGIRELKEEPGLEIQVHGSGQLAQTLTEHGLVDEYRLLTYPVLLHDGKRLFGERGIPISLRLITLRTTSKGGIVATYRPAGPALYGSFALDE